MVSVSLKKQQLPPPPVHVAIIMDGNGRWAKARGLPRTAGHKRGAESVRRSVKGAIANGVSYLTLFGFSSENWKRPAEEIHDLMGLLRFYLKSEIKSLHKEGVRLQVIGDRARLADDIVSLIEESENLTKTNSQLVLTIALSYGGRAEIMHAAKQIAEDIASGALKASEVDETAFSQRLFTADMPDPESAHEILQARRSVLDLVPLEHRAGVIDDADRVAPRGPVDPGVGRDGRMHPCLLCWSKQPGGTLRGDGTRLPVAY